MLDEDVQQIIKDSGNAGLDFLKVNIIIPVWKSEKSDDAEWFVQQHQEVSVNVESALPWFSPFLSVGGEIRNT
ncbi:hypothetical protein CapIbe_005823 [Capra ibex]